MDVVAVRVIPVEAEFAAERVGTRLVGHGTAGGAVLEAPHRRTLYMHAPGSIAYPIEVPEAGRLDVGIGVVRSSRPVTFIVTVERPGGKVDTLLEESGGLLWVRPTGRIHWLRFARTGSLTAEGTSPCGPLCISEESGAWRAISTLPDEPGWVLDLSCYRPPELPHRCSVVSAEPCVRVARCK